MWIRVKTYGGAVELTQDDGTPIEKILSVDIRIRPLEPVTAALQFLMPFSDVVVNATVSEKHLRELADAHGFDLVKRRMFPVKQWRRRAGDGKEEYEPNHGPAAAPS